MKLFKCEDGYRVDVSPELYLISEFDALLTNRENDKDTLLKELGYIYFMHDVESDFMSQTNNGMRHDEIVRYLNLPSGWKVDHLLQKAIEAYLYLSETLSSKLLTTARKSVDKLNIQLDKLDLDERDKSGKPIYNLKQFNDTVTQLPNTMEALDKAEKMYIKGVAEKGKLKGNKDKKIFEDGFGKLVQKN